MVLTTLGESTSRRKKNSQRPQGWRSKGWQRWEMELYWKRKKGWQCEKMPPSLQLTNSFSMLSSKYAVISAPHATPARPPRALRHVA